MVIVDPAFLKFLDEGNVWMIPGSTYGERGEGYVRISNAQPVERIAKAQPVERIAKAMERMESFIS